MLKNAIMIGVVSLLAIALIGGSAVILFGLKPVVGAAAQGGWRARLDMGQGGLVPVTQGDEWSPGSQFNAVGNRSSSGNGNGNGVGIGNNSVCLDASCTGSGATGRNGAGQGGTGASTRNARNPEAVEWENLIGEVVVVGNEITVKTTDGEVVVGLGQEQYRQDAGFAVALGDTVSIRGYLEDGEFKAGSIENMTTEESLALRLETGRPLWAGNGRQLNQR
jgi:hypothetical protein